MPKLRRLSGQQVISIFQSFGFEVVSRRGSHVKLRRVQLGIRQTLTVPDHPELDTGTLRAILRHATAYIPDAELAPHFITE